MEIISKLLYNVGEKGPLGLTLLSLFVLWNKGNLFYYYTIGIVFNMLLNICLKGIFQQPRPSVDSERFNLAITNGRNHRFFNTIPFEIYGMPSGHTQAVIFSSVYVFLSLKNQTLLLFYLFVSLITMWQRVEYKFHTLAQVVAGAIVGGLFAHAMFQTAKKNIMGITKAKEDDNAPY